MNDLEQRVREAFDEVSLPPEVRARTLAAIDDLVQPREASPSKPPAPRMVKWRRAAIALAACLVLAAVGLIGSRLYFEETAFVGIDVNPSIELGINRFDIVVSAKAYNEDGEALLRDVSVTGKPYDSAVATLTSSTAFAPYLESDAYIAISVASNDAGQSDTLRTQSDACLRSLSCEGSCHTVDAETRAAASAAGMGAGRYQAALRLLELDGSLTLEDCASMSMHELRSRIAALEGGEPEGEGGQQGGAGWGSGHDGPAGNGHGQGAGQGKGASGKGHHAE
ncbi:hypothetical protein NE582_13885 [Gordonibacter pamelaeae]|uniref:anti-sigma-I factor RsgI family protein n=1 Tax=Gordonibacter pamelaeae TaxID=471189 RepID=UPI00210B4AAC|nr:hypothetical protein [Gordonibacter pamelaeae]MCQ4848308.1 hypothetical protein [Gordonibacter pamelaeae]MCQ4848965.1 hypothetical protein [Gordonibacter pamelaeae]